MEPLDVKSTWDSVTTPVLPTTEIHKMLSENRHPVLKDIRKQLTIEIIAWCVFLACYYTMFDGDKKPMWINLVLVFSIILPLAHNLAGYRFARFLVLGPSIRLSLRNYLTKLKTYAIISILLRQINLTGLLVFFFYGLEFNTDRYILLAVISFIFAIQLIITWRIWVNRLKTLRQSLESFSDV